MEEKRISSRKVRVGKVVSDKMDKTVVVAIADRVAHCGWMPFLAAVFPSAGGEPRSSSPPGGSA